MQNIPFIDIAWYFDDDMDCWLCGFILLRNKGAAMGTNICKAFFIVALLTNLTNVISANKNSARLAKSTPAINESSARFALTNSNKSKFITFNAEMIKIKEIELASQDLKNSDKTR